MLSSYLQWFSDLSNNVEDACLIAIHRKPSSNDNVSPNGEMSSINGVTVPEEVIRQLRSMLTTPLCWLTQNELQEAVNGYIADGNVFDDPEGYSILDMIEKTSEEMDNASGAMAFYERYQNLKVRPLHVSQQTHEERLLYELMENNASMPCHGTQMPH